MSEGRVEGERGFVVPVSEDGGEWLSFDPSGSGWAAFRSPVFDGERARLFFRFGLDRGYDIETRFVNHEPAIIYSRNEQWPDAFIQVREMLFGFGSGAAGRVLRDAPVTRVEAAVNQPGYRQALLERLPGPDSAMEPFPSARPNGWWFTSGKPLKRPPLKLEVPQGRSRPDSFYKSVAAAFSYMSVVSQRPAQDLADENGVPVTTVHGWVKEARRRGFLASGERSKGQE